jgi:hypothetical protein
MSIKELDGILEFYSPHKGIILFTRPWTKLYSGATMLVEVDTLPGGCIVTLKAILAGNPFRNNWACRRYEKKFAKRIQQNVT